MLIDTHCHLDDGCLADRLTEVLERARSAGVEKIIIPGVTSGSWEKIAALCAEFPDVYPAFGLHPLYSAAYDVHAGNMLRLLMPSAVAVGEIGLDYTYQHVPRQIQIAAFREQLKIAIAANRPVLLHCRRAFQDLLTILREEQVQRVGGVMHAFSGSPEIAAECLRLGLYISFAGSITYKNAVKPLEVANRVPLERLLLETDAPDLAPEPYRGRFNQPAYIVEILKRIAALKGLSAAEVAAATTANAERLFSFSK